MKCAKCGYISFDHLSECKKCQTSLAAVREELGFSAVKPLAPSLLASLLRDYHTQGQQNRPETAPPPDPFSFQEQTGSAQPDATGESEEDFSLLDLSDAELERLIERDQSPEISMPAEADTALRDELTLNFDDFDEPVNETKPSDGLELLAHSRTAPGWSENDPPLTLEFEHAPDQRPEASSDDFVIDLSESDLDALLKRLEDNSEGET
ncbi:MAG: hypothetical protein P4L43_10385 [Syntrophobacteraceae bacterium]|nr:hypothetical protein [Syntrophobacteraceae bacterium]